MVNVAFNIFMTKVIQTDIHVIFIFYRSVTSRRCMNIIIKAAKMSTDVNVALVCLFTTV